MCRRRAGGGLRDERGHVAASGPIALAYVHRDLRRRCTVTVATTPPGLVRGVEAYGRVQGRLLARAVRSRAP
jgi:hypothetical protein